MKLNLWSLTTTATLLLCAAPAFSQAAATAQNVPGLPYKAVPNFFETPPGDYLGESQGVATNSKGDIFSSFAALRVAAMGIRQHGQVHPRDRQGLLRLLVRDMVRADPQDNIWTVDEGTNVITKFSPDGSKILMVLGYRPSVMDGVVARCHGPNPPDEKYTFCRPTDVAWDQQGDIFVADGYCNNRVVKYDRDGRFLAKVGGAAAGKELGEFNLPHALQVDHEGNVYVADRGNNRYVVLDNDLKPKTTYTNVGTAWTDCISQGPHQYLFASNSNPNGNGPGTWQRTGQIYKMELDGTVVKFGYAGKLAPGFQVVHAIDCRNPDQLIVGEIESWRVQKFVLQPK